MNVLNKEGEMPSENAKELWLSEVGSFDSMNDIDFTLIMKEALKRAEGYKIIDCYINNFAGEKRYNYQFIVHIMKA